MEFYVAKIANYLLEPLYILSFFLLILIFLLLFTNFKRNYNSNISVELIGIGYDLNLVYAEKISDIKNITINTAFKQEETQEILAKPLFSRKNAPKLPLPGDAPVA